MTIEEHRDEALYLVKSLNEDPSYRIHYDHEAVSLIAFAVENNNPDLLETVARKTNDWLEGEDDKDARNYLLQALTEHFEHHD